MVLGTRKFALTNLFLDPPSSFSPICFSNQARGLIARKLYPAPERLTPGVIRCKRLSFTNGALHHQLSYGIPLKLVKMPSLPWRKSNRRNSSPQPPQCKLPAQLQTTTTKQSSIRTSLAWLQLHNDTPGMSHPSPLACNSMSMVLSPLYTSSLCPQF